MNKQYEVLDTFSGKFVKSDYVEKNSEGGVFFLNDG